MHFGTETSGFNNQADLYSRVVFFQVVLIVEFYRSKMCISGTVACSFVHDIERFSRNLHKLYYSQCKTGFTSVYRNRFLCWKSRSQRENAQKKEIYFTNFKVSSNNSLLEEAVNLPFVDMCCTSTAYAKKK